MRYIFIVSLTIVFNILNAQSVAIERLDSVQKNSTEEDFYKYLTNREMAFVYGNYIFTLSNNPSDDTGPYLYYRLNHKSYCGQWEIPWIGGSNGRPYFEEWVRDFNLEEKGYWKSRGDFVRERFPGTSSIEVIKTDFGEYYIMFVHLKLEDKDHTEIIALHFTDRGNSFSIDQEIMSLRTLFKKSGREEIYFYGKKEQFFHNNDKTEWLYFDYLDEKKDESGSYHARHVIHYYSKNGRKFTEPLYYDKKFNLYDLRNNK